MPIEDLVHRLNSLHSFYWAERAVLADTIHRELKSSNSRWTVRLSAQALEKAHTWLYEELKIAKFLRTHPEIKKQESRELALKFIRDSKRSKR